MKKIATTEDDSLFNSVEVSSLEVDGMSLEQEVKAGKARLDRLASVDLAKPICENNEIADGKELIAKLSSFAKDIDLAGRSLAAPDFRVNHSRINEMLNWKQEVLNYSHHYLIKRVIVCTANVSK